MDLAVRIIKLRREKKLSQQALADLIGISRSALAQWETSLSRPGIENLRKMAESLGASFEWLATGRGNQYIEEVFIGIPDSQLDSEINRMLPRLNTKSKKALINIIQEMH